MGSSKSPINFSGASVLELGAGSGLAGMVAVRLGAQNVVITDGDQTSVDLAAQNLIQNGIPCDKPNVCVTRLLWGQQKLFRANRSDLVPESGFDVIVAADVMYKKELPLLLFRTVKDLLAPSGVVYLCHLVRAGVTQRIVVDAAEAAGLEVELSHMPENCLPSAYCLENDLRGAQIYLMRHARC